MEKGVLSSHVRDGRGGERTEYRTTRTLTKESPGSA